jgi:pimeloyl-ACP methyl ester carboxylesterase
MGAGPPLVVVNGFAATKDDWDPAFVAGLATDHEPILVDNRGMGESPDDGLPFAIEDLAADLAGLIDALGLERPVATGWSMARFPHSGHGFMADHPDTLARLIGTFLAVD